MKAEWIRQVILAGCGVIILFLFNGFCKSAAGQNLTLKYAQKFSVKELAGCRLVTIHPTWKDKSNALRYLLVPRGKAVPKHHPSAQVISVPARRIISLSITHLAYISAAEQIDRLVGIGGLKYVNTPAVRHRIDAGSIKEVGPFVALKFETVLNLSPDLILTSASGSAYDVHPKLVEAGLPTVLMIDHLESHPLGRLEWIKFLSLFLNTEAHAETLFNIIEKRYSQMAEKASNLSPKPKIITGVPFQGQWWVPKGNSYVAQLINDAGGSYCWSETAGTGSQSMDIEAVYEKALSADVWLNTGNWKSIKDAQASDPRFTTIPALTQGRVYNNNNRLNQWGGNDYWESGMLNPDIILADLITILHPEVLPQHKLVFYRRLTP